MPATFTWMGGNNAQVVSEQSLVAFSQGGNDYILTCSSRTGGTSDTPVGIYNRTTGSYRSFTLPTGSASRSWAMAVVDGSPWVIGEQGRLSYRINPAAGTVTEVVSGMTDWRNTPLAGIPICFSYNGSAWSGGATARAFNLTTLPIVGFRPGAGPGGSNFTEIATSSAVPGGQARTTPLVWFSAPYAYQLSRYTASGVLVTTEITRTDVDLGVVTTYTFDASSVWSGVSISAMPVVVNGTTYAFNTQTQSVITWTPGSAPFLTIPNIGPGNIFNNTPVALGNSIVARQSWDVFFVMDPATGNITTETVPDGVVPADRRNNAVTTGVVIGSDLWAPTTNT